MRTLADIQAEVAAHTDGYVTAQKQTATASYGSTAVQAIEAIHHVCKAAAPHHKSGCLAYVGYLLSNGHDSHVAKELSLAIELAVASTTLYGQHNIVAAKTADHMAEIILANILGTTTDDRIKAVSILHRSSLLVLHGRAKPLYFDYVNAIHTGMVLAGGDCHDTDDITPFAKALAIGNREEARRLATNLQSRWPAADLLVSITDL